MVVWKIVKDPKIIKSTTKVEMFQFVVKIRTATICNARKDGKYVELRNC